jgi:protein-S-isoprenylcysteine O-methyltransferase Ste14
VPAAFLYAGVMIFIGRRAAAYAAFGQTYVDYMARVDRWCLKKP